MSPHLGDDEDGAEAFIHARQACCIDAMTTAPFCLLVLELHAAVPGFTPCILSALVQQTWTSGASMTRQWQDEHA